jgi:hypothetical protein
LSLCSGDLGLEAQRGRQQEGPEGLEGGADRRLDHCTIEYPWRP